MDPVFIKMFKADVQRMGIDKQSLRDFNNVSGWSQIPTQITTTLTRSMKTSTSVRSALCIIPPNDKWSEIQDIRRLHDPAYSRWMPHINIFFPFIDEVYFDSISNYIQHNIIQKNNIGSFDIILQDFDVFDRVKNGQVDNNKTETLFLKPVGCTSKLQNIFNHLSKDWCTCASGHSEFNPHLTVGKFKARDILAQKRSFQPSWSLIRFRCDALYLISRRGSKPFEIRHKIPLC
eukprot:195954_1